MPAYHEVVAASGETATKLLAMRSRTRYTVTTTTNGGRTASVNWDAHRQIATINMPGLPPDAMLTRSEADRLVAFVAHECCHVLRSDPDAWRDACAAGQRVQYWTNALEDVRIEAAEIKAGHFPALRSLLGTIANHLFYEAVVESRKTGRVIGAKISDAPYVATILGRLANKYAIPSAAGLEANLSPEVAKLLRVALDGVRRCQSTHDVLTLARRLVAMEHALPPVAPPQQPQPGPQDAEDAEDGSQGSQDAEAGSQGSQDVEDGSQGSQDAEDGSQGSQDAEDGSQGSQDAGGGSQGSQDAPSGSQDTQDAEDGSQGPAIDTDMTSTVQTIARRAGIADLEASIMEGNGSALSIMRSTVTDGTRGATVPVEHNTAAARVLGTRLPRNAVLAGQISRLLVSAERRSVTHRESSGRLDRRALARMRTGALDVFARRDDAPGVDTALMILIDGSSSMRAIAADMVALQAAAKTGNFPAVITTRMDIAQTAAWHIAGAAERAAAKVAIAAFNTLVVSHLGGPVRGPVAGAAITLVKPWDTLAADCAFGLSQVGPCGGTPLSPAIVECSRLLSEVSATRRILMVLTDGDCDYGSEAVRAACRLAEHNAVETVGIGLACDSVIAAFPPRYSINVENLDQLAARGLGALVAMLEDAAGIGG